MNISLLSWLRVPPASVLAVAGCLWVSLLPAQLFENLKSLAPRLPVGAAPGLEGDRGPKGIAAADFNGDGIADFAVSDKNGSVTVYLSAGASGFRDPLFLSTGTNELRGIVAADVNRDGRPDLLTVSPFDGMVHVFLNQGAGAFTDHPFFAWIGARDLVVGDFDGDEILDLGVAGVYRGLQQYRGLGEGGFAAVTVLSELDAGQCGSSNNFPQPAYFLQRFRTPGQSRDSLVAAHGEGCNRLWVISPDQAGLLRIVGTLTNVDVNAIAVGAVSRPIADGVPDLVTTSLDGSYLEVRRFQTATGTFELDHASRIDVPGGPRSIKLVDWNGDGWNDLAVVLRFFERVTLFNNTNGVFTAGPKINVGRLPREIEAADFTGDGHPDLAVVNRYSLDVSIIPGFPAASTFAALDQVYAVDGTVSGLNVRDYNHDGRDDVGQLHIASAEMSVRLADPKGLLGEPKYYPVGFRPSAQTVTDVNNDSIPDVVVVDLQGSISVRLGLGDGSFGPEQVFTLPPNLRGGLFALVAADFDNDGKVDLAAGFVDCRLVLLKGNGDGTFLLSGDHDHPLYFAYEARSMAAADFDGDGDIDLVGAGMDGRISVVENLGDILSARELKITSFASPNLSDIRSIQIIDENKDGDWDLFVAGPKGSALFLGGPGLTFALKTRDSFDGGGTTTATGDFDGDGRLDLAVADSDSKTLTLYVRKNDEAPWEPALIVGVPSANYLATGDLDGDGKADLVGSGEVLWTALSGRASRLVPSALDGGSRAVANHVTINEVMASNTGLPLAQDGDRTSDWLELFNGAGLAQGLAGWSVQVLHTNASGLAITNQYSFPEQAVMPAKSHLLVICTDKRRTAYHTGFPLPAEGGTLELFNRAGERVDMVSFPAQDSDHSFARFQDGSTGWVVNPYPSPGRANQDNGTLDPKVQLEGFDPETLRPGVPLRFRARGRDDLGIVTMAIYWRRIDVPDLVDHRAILFDDGMHDDGATQDGLFSGTLGARLPAGAQIQFYLLATDLTDKSITVPDRPGVSLASLDTSLYSLAVGVEKPTLEISEVVALNEAGLRDELGGAPDWVELRNYGQTSVPLKGLSLARAFFGSGDRYEFPAGAVLRPGEYIIVYCDNPKSHLAWHAPFQLDAGGDEVFLTSVLPNGVRTLVDWVKFGPQLADIAWVRQGVRGPWKAGAPSPRLNNFSGLWMGMAEGELRLVLPTVAGSRYQVETTESLLNPQWRNFETVSGDGLDHAFPIPSGAGGFYRVRSP